MIEIDDHDCIQVQLPRFRRSQTSDASQSESTKFLIQSTEEWLCSRVRVTERPELRLDVGLPPQSSLVNGHKLDSYALAFSDRIKALTGRQLHSLRLTKCHNSLTTLRLTEMADTVSPRATRSVAIKTRKSYAKPGFESEIRNATEKFSQLLDKSEQLHLTIAYTTGLPRTWSRLWEPTIKGVLFRPNRNLDSARISVLHLHRVSLGDSFEHWVEIVISTP